MGLFLFIVFRIGVLIFNFMFFMIMNFLIYILGFLSFFGYIIIEKRLMGDWLILSL